MTMENDNSMHRPQIGNIPKKTQDIPETSLTSFFCSSSCCTTSLCFLYSSSSSCCSMCRSSLICCPRRSANSITCCSCRLCHSVPPSVDGSCFMMAEMTSADSASLLFSTWWGFHEIVFHLFIVQCNLFMCKSVAIWRHKICLNGI